MRSARAYQQVAQSTAVAGANPVGLTILLYEKLLDLFIEAGVALEAGDIERRTRVTGKALEIIETGLMTALDFERGGEISSNLRKLYRFWMAEIISFNFSRDYSKLISINGQIRDILAAFREVNTMTKRQQT